MIARIDAIKIGFIAVLLASLALTVPAAGTYRESLAAGQKKLQAKDYAGAKAEAAEARKLSSADAEKNEAALFLGRVMEALGEHAEARALYAQLADLPSMKNNPAALMGVARTYEAEKNWPAARGEYEKVLKREGLPEGIRFQAQNRIVETYCGEADLAGMRGAVEKLLELPGPVDKKSGGLLNLGNLAMKKNELAQARETYTRVMALPDVSGMMKSNALNRLAHSYTEEGTVRAGMDSCDPYGLPRESQQRQFNTKTADYLKAHPDAKFALGVETPARKVFRDKLWFRGEYSDQVMLSAARNEYEAFQLCVIPLEVIGPEMVKGVSLSATDMVSASGTKISAADVKIWKVGYLRTRPPSYPTCHVGYWPDPLLEHDTPTEVEGHQLQPFWIRVHVPGGTAPGQYQGGIKVTTDTHGNQIFTINIRVRAFTLPSDPKLIFHALRYLELDTYMNYYKISKEAARDMVKHYTETLIGEYKFFPASADFYDKDDTDFSRFDALMEPLMQKGMKLCRTIPSVKFEGLTGGGIEPAEFKRFADHLRQKGWLQENYVYCFHDEPSEELYPKTREYAAKLKELVPDVKILTSESPHPGLAGFTDAWWSDVSTEDPVYNRERQRAGDRVLWYFCRIPIFMDRIYNSIWDSPLMLIDRAATEQRVVFWLAWKYKMDGIMIWAGGDWYKKGKTTWPEEPWDPYHDDYNWPYGGADNGNGVLFYPGKQGPLPSVRLEALREGREDYEYLWLLNNLAGNNPPEDVAQALAVNPLVCVTPHMFTKDPAAFYKERDKIAELIERYQKKGMP